MGRIVATLAIIALMCSLGSALAGDNSEANRLFVEAVKLVTVVDNEVDIVRRLDALEEALDKLYEIIEKHSSSDIATKLINGQDTMGGLSLEHVSDVAVKARVMYYEGGMVPENYAEQFVRIFDSIKELKVD